MKPQGVLMTLHGTLENIGLRQLSAQRLGIAAGFTIQSTALCAVVGMLLVCWPALHGAVQGVGSGCALYLWARLRRGRGTVAAGERAAFADAAARQLLSPRAWLIAATAVMLLLPEAREPVLMAAYTGTI